MLAVTPTESRLRRETWSCLWEIILSMFIEMEDLVCSGWVRSLPEILDHIREEEQPSNGLCSMPSASCLLIDVNVRLTKAFATLAFPTMM